MPRLVRPLAALLAVAATLPPAQASPPPRPGPYPDVVNRVAGMVSDPAAQQAASAHGMGFVNVLWEDTGRWQGSALGPNISDVTIEVVSGDGAGRKLALMPVLRFPNFTDRTADIPIDRVWLRVGNARPGAPDQVITLRDFLADPSRFLTGADRGRIRTGSLLAPRDTHALVSAQAAFLPVPREGQATFHPVIFNYQSTAGNPAVLTLLVTRQGTSLTVVDNARDTVSGGQSWGQRLFFNAGGARAPLTAERLSDVRAHGATANGESAGAVGEDANLLLIIQVPLKHREPLRRGMAYEAMPSAPMAAAPAKRARGGASDLETAVIGHGALEGPFTELAGLEVERDPRFPVRVTVQFYQATATGQVTAEDVARLAGVIGKVYEKADFVGSLVVPGPGDPRRPTAWDGATTAPPDVSMRDFPGLEERWRTHGPPPPPIGVR